MEGGERLLPRSVLRSFIAPHEWACPDGSASIVVFGQCAKTITILPCKEYLTTHFPLPLPTLYVAG